jgi:hypothetical protein
METPIFIIKICWSDLPFAIVSGPEVPLRRAVIRPTIALTVILKGKGVGGLLCVRLGDGVFGSIVGEVMNAIL